MRRPAQSFTAVSREQMAQDPAVLLRAMAFAARIRWQTVATDGQAITRSARLPRVIFMR